MVHFFMAMSRLSVVFLQFRGSEPSFNARERERLVTLELLQADLLGKMSSFW